MNQSPRRVAVIGLGAAGSMALLSLSRRGAEVVGFDPRPAGHDDGAFGGETRQLRLASHDSHSADYVRLASEALGLWNRLERDSGQTLFLRTGQLAIGPSDDPDLKVLAASLEAEGLDHDVLTPSEVAERFPQHVLGVDERGIYAHEAGVLRSNVAVRAALDVAQGLGATVEAATVTSVQWRDDHVVVVADGREHTFDEVVVTAGPWTGKLVPQIKQLVTARMIISAWFEPADGMSFDPATFPPGFRRSSGPHAFTFLPAVDRSAAKFVYWIPMRPEVDDPDTWDRTPAPDALAATQRALAACLRGVATEPDDAQMYVEGFTADRWPIVTTLQPGITVLTGFSGSGFAVAPVMGEIAADLALDGATARDISGMQIDRPSIS